LENRSSSRTPSLGADPLRSPSLSTRNPIVLVYLVSPNIFPQQPSNLVQPSIVTCKLGYGVWLVQQLPMHRGRASSTFCLHCEAHHPENALMFFWSICRTAFKGARKRSFPVLKLRRWTCKVIMLLRLYGKEHHGHQSNSIQGYNHQKDSGVLQIQ
jgi:hypothetical protein